ncbi:hypothetical protein M9978_04620 [Sphingomonas sp. MG17]|uniref:MASP n=1 Tax=Sphingomonas tagetis TaxID=2949092 RepID=A0A9X2HEN0_9SPHN|nr:hypothetical protein [Sphingomonas tagetis]MCP3729706.1 hypothetical protein [Sphingomonas tagetis]
MRIFTKLPLGVAAAALIATSSPVFAQGKADRARAAVAEARARVDTAAQLAPEGEVSRYQVEAKAALRSAEENLARMSKDQAIATANEASRLADLAIAASQRAQARATDRAAARADVEASRRADAESAAASAQADAAAANARAEAAADSARAAQAEAAAARAAQAAPVTVTTETVKTTAATAPRTVTRTAARKPVAKRKVVRTVKRSTPVRAAAVTERTKTTVTTQR